MLCLKREVDQRTIITVPPSDKPTIIEEMVIESSPSWARLGYTAPDGVVIDREELHLSKQRDAANKAKRDAEKARIAAGKAQASP